MTSTNRREWLELVLAGAATLPACSQNTTQNRQTDLKRYYYDLCVSPGDLSFEIYTNGVGQSELNLLRSRFDAAKAQSLSVNEIAVLLNITAPPEKPEDALHPEATPILHFLVARACEHDTLETRKAMQLFLERGGSINWKDRHGDTVLHALYSAPNYRDNPSRFNELEAFLIERGARKNIKNHGGKTASDIKNEVLGKASGGKNPL
jgi:hypothetical protein